MDKNHRINISLWCLDIVIFIINIVIVLVNGPSTINNIGGWVCCTIFATGNIGNQIIKNRNEKILKEILKSKEEEIDG